MTTTQPAPTIVAPTPDPGDRHLPGLDAASTVPTQTFRKAQLLLGDTVRLNGIAAVSGPPGCGKTFAVDHFVRTHPVMQGRQWHWLDMPPQPTTKEVTVRLLDAVGEQRPLRATEYELTELLAPALISLRPVVVVDEAQNLKTNGLQQLRYLHDRGQGRSWTLLLVGSTVNRSLAGAAELGSRVSSWLAFVPLTGTEPLLRALHAWHPLLAATPAELLLRVDAFYARGNFRLWAQFLRALLSLLEHRPAGTVPDDHLISAALASVSPSPVRAQ